MPLKNDAVLCMDQPPYLHTKWDCIGSHELCMCKFGGEGFISASTDLCVRALGSCHTQWWTTTCLGSKVMQTFSAYTLSTAALLLRSTGAILHAWDHVRRPLQPTVMYLLWATLTGEPLVWVLGLCGPSVAGLLWATVSLACFLPDPAIDFLLKPTHLLLQLTNQVHNTLTKGREK